MATPAVARTGPYVGIEGGVIAPKRQNGNFRSTFTQSAQTPAAGTPSSTAGENVGALPVALTTGQTGTIGSSRVKFKRGYDVDAVLGYDFGFFRLEGELGYKRSKLRSFSQDTAFGNSVNTVLNPAGTTGTAFAFPSGNATTFNLGRRVSVASGMVNALLDIGGDTGPSFYAGGGAGRARVKAFRDRDTVWAYQGIAGVRVPLGTNLDIGLKYRYFRTDRVDVGPGSTSFSSTRTAVVPNVPATAGGTATGTTPVNFTRTANVNGQFDNRFKSHSLLLTLGFNFGGVAEQIAPPPPPPPPVEVAPPPPPPATQTCPDGSVVLATDVCPAPPPPPPPPEAAPERG